MDVSRTRARRGATVVLGFAAIASDPASGIEFSYSGYIREHLSVNLQNAPEHTRVLTPGETIGRASRFDESAFDTLGGKGELSMARTTLKLDGLLDLGFAQVVAVGRAVREHHTEYEKRLQYAASQLPAWAYDGGIQAQNGDAYNPTSTSLFALIPGPNGASSGQAVKLAGELIRDSGSIAGGLDELVELLTAAPRAPGRIQFAGDDVGLHGGRTFFQEYDDEELREIFVQFDIGQKNHFRLGRQQVVWGETDFFRGMDIIHGYDLRWRLFLELENEELRKPLILFNYSRDIPKIDGAVQFIYRPGWDKGEDVGDQLPLSGGRWAPQPIRGLDLLTLAPYNYHSCNGDENDPNYGMRLSGVTKQIGWSLNYYRSMAQAPVLNRNPRLGGTPGMGCFGSAIGDGTRINDPRETIRHDRSVAGAPTELIFPMVDTFGITANMYAGGWLDGVLRTEIAFTPNQPYNAGKNTWVDGPFALLGYWDGPQGDKNGDGADDIPASVNTSVPVLGADVLGLCDLLGGAPCSVDVPNTVLFGPSGQVLYDTSEGGDPLMTNADGSRSPEGCWLCLYLPGLREVVEKPTLKIMFGIDKQLYWTRNRLFKTQRPATWLFQVFDQWVLDFDKNEEILELPGYGATRREHTVYVTNAVILNYKYDQVLPGLAVGFDAGNFDSFALPFVDLLYGDHWRVHAEVSLFFAKHANDRGTNPRDRDTRLLGGLVNHDQATVRLTYQF
jgi:hypothetical protein